MNKPPFKMLDFAPPAVEVSERDDGAVVLRSPMNLAPYEDSLGHMLRRWEREAPERTFLAERADDGAWRRLTYGEAASAVRGLAQALLDRGLGPDHPLMLLSDNSIDHALMSLASMDVGVPAVPISPAYSLMSRDYGKLKYVFGELRPRLVYAADGKLFAPALAALDLADASIVVSANAGPGAERFADLLATTPGADGEVAFGQVGPDTVAKVLFTSGSTGMPKGVINTQRMLCSNQQATAQLWRFVEARPPVVLDWLPWSHTFGGNYNFDIVLRNGGTFYIDGGKPAPGLIEQTVANIRDVSSTMYFNVPRGFDMLIPYLRDDDGLRESFFAELDMIFYAGAALPRTLWQALEALSIEARGERVLMLSAWGSTETAPLATSVYFPIERAGVIGLPVPGTAVKMVPDGAKMELRVKGPNVTPGYWRRDDLTRAAFDEEGYFRMGDAGKLADPKDASKGLVFDGRTAENFKLMSGTWVHVGELRLAAIEAGAPLIQDAVITGHDREEIGLLVFANPAACHAMCGDAREDAPLAELIARDEVRAHLAKGLAAHNSRTRGSSRRFDRALLMAEPPDIDKGEITDKGYINQRAVLEARAAAVAKLHGDGDPNPEIILID